MERRWLRYIELVALLNGSLSSQLGVERVTLLHERVRDGAIRVRNEYDGAPSSVFVGTVSHRVPYGYFAIFADD